MIDKRRGQIHAAPIPRRKGANASPDRPRPLPPDRELFGKSKATGGIEWLNGG
jgi:hypothetical protein